jgi:hypothetical protein
MNHPSRASCKLSGRDYNADHCCNSPPAYLLAGRTYKISTERAWMMADRGADLLLPTRPEAQGEKELAIG